MNQTNLLVHSCLSFMTFVILDDEDMEQLSTHT